MIDTSWIRKTRFWGFWTFGKIEYVIWWYYVILNLLVNLANIILSNTENEILGNIDEF